LFPCEREPPHSCVNEDLKQEKRGRSNVMADRNLFHFTGTFSLFSSSLSVKVGRVGLFLA
jgi:hypothetical protein